MQPIDELTTTLNLYFQWNEARMDCFVGMLIGFRLISVTLTKNIIYNQHIEKKRPGIAVARLSHFYHVQNLNL